MSLIALQLPEFPPSSRKNLTHCPNSIIRHPRTRRSSIETMPHRQQHIVLIQDDPYLVATRKQILESRGYSVEVVQSVSEARARCREFKCDLVIVDANKAHTTALE